MNTLRLLSWVPLTERGFERVPSRLKHRRSKRLARQPHVPAVGGLFHNLATMATRTA